MTRDDITSMAREAGFVGMDGDHGALRRFAVLVAAAEREACAKVCEEERNELLWREGQTLPRGEPRLIHMAGTASQCAAAIRARGEK